MKKKRIFSIPYNGSDPSKFISELTKRAGHVHSVFLSIPIVFGSHQDALSPIIYKSNQIVSSLEEYDFNCREFLRLSKNLGMKRILALNAGCYNQDLVKKYILMESQLYPLITEFSIDGIIVTDFSMATKLHQDLPEVELHTSCNCFQWNLKTMDIWAQKAGVKIFNPPREILRTPKALKEMHDAGFKLKCLINEACLYGCPNTVNHAMYIANGVDHPVECGLGDLTNVFKGNYVLPRWLNKLDEYVDIYKISGRLNPTYYIFRTLDAYLNEDNDMNLFDLVIGGPSKYGKDLGLNIPLSAIPDKLLTCQCKDCNKTCFVCSNLMRKFNPDGQDL